MLTGVPNLSTVFISLHLKLLDKTVHGCKCVNKKRILLFQYVGVKCFKLLVHPNYKTTSGHVDVCLVFIS